MTFGNNLTKRDCKVSMKSSTTSYGAKFFKVALAIFHVSPKWNPISSFHSQDVQKILIILLPLQLFLFKVEVQKGIIMTSWKVLHEFSICNFWITLKPLWVRTSKVNLVVDLWVKNISEHIWNHKVPGPFCSS